MEEDIEEIKNDLKELSEILKRKLFLETFEKKKNYIKEKIENFPSEEYCFNKCGFLKTCYANQSLCIKQIFYDALNELPPIEQCIIKLKCGFYDNKCWDEYEISREFGLDCEYIESVIQRIVRKLRSYRNLELLRAFSFDVFSNTLEMPFKNLLLTIYADKPFNCIIGIDESIVVTDKKLKCKIADIKKELDADISDIEWLSSFTKELKEHKITTLNHLLHIGRMKLFRGICKSNDITFFELENLLLDKGYRVKCINRYPFSMRQELAILLKEVLIPIYSIYDEPLMDLSLEMVLNLTKQGINTIENLLYNINEINLTQKEKTWIDDYLKTRGMLHSINGIDVYLTSGRMDGFLNRLTADFKTYKYSISTLIEEIKVLNISNFKDLINYIDKNYSQINWLNYFIDYEDE